jgi:hypothetical protein
MRRRDDLSRVIERQGFSWNARRAKPFSLFLNIGRSAMTGAPKGLFRQPAVGEDEAIAYVASDGATMFLTESEYRAEGFSPPFETLPSQEEYEADAENEDIEATEDEDVARGPFNV